MHRKERLNELVKQWLDLALEETCVRADAHSRLILKHSARESEIRLIDSRLNTTKLIIGIFDNSLAYTTGYNEKDEYVVIGLAIWTLEQTLEKY